MGSRKIQVFVLICYMLKHVFKVKEKILRCPKLNYSRPEDGRKRQERINQFTAGQNQLKNAFILESMLEL